MKIATDSNHHILQAGDTITIFCAHVYEEEASPFPPDWTNEQILQHCFEREDSVDGDGNPAYTQKIYPFVP